MGKIKRSYKISLKDLIPIYGMSRYMTRIDIKNSRDMNEFGGRAIMLGLYNFVALIPIAYGIARGLEALVK